MGSPIRLIASILLLLTMVVSSEEPNNGLKKDEVWVCVRWRWVQTALEQKVNCVEWAKKDCSNRLYPDICKRGG
jgi:hypothetical protein